MRPFYFLLVVWICSFAVVNSQEEKLTSDQVMFFESKIRPVLADACYECHSNEGGRVKGGLALDTREAMLLGGDSGEVLIPGKPDESLLWIALSYTDPDYEMPPKNKLSPDIVADFRKWIEMGAPDPRVSETVVVKSEIDIEEGKKFWSFQKPVKPNTPKVKNADWPGSDLDHFILSKLEEQNLTPSSKADPETLNRRLYFDLTGLPPTPRQQDEFLSAWKTNPEEAIESTVDQLLASPQYGERWGRHWLDVARYAESTGKETNMTFPHAWRYRDYVIDSFNADKPYDHFLSQQIAGDLLPAKTDEIWQENLIATGFLAMGTKGLNQDNGRQFTMDVVDEQIDTMTQSVLGLTVACARCHDHKFDPIPTTDYYSLAGIFLSSTTYFGTIRNAQNKRPSDLLILPVPDPVGPQISDSELESLNDRLTSMRRELIQLRQDRNNAKGNAAADALRQSIRTLTQSQVLQARINGYYEDGTPKTFAMGLQQNDSPVEAAVLVRGEVDKPAQVVERGFVQVLQHAETPTIESSSGGRRELAKWITSKESPLTARVMVNRIWIHLFGKGLVDSPDNFGTTGQLPSHPELLDYLAVRFMENDWSVKSMIREIVLSNTYQMSSDFDSANYDQDPENKWLWRANPRRLNAESIRDAILAVSTSLDLDPPRASPIANVGDVRVGIRVNEEMINRPTTYRSVYLPVVRDMTPESLALFDFAEPDTVRGTRESTNVPSQALYMMNNPFVTTQAKLMAADLVKSHETSRDRILDAFRRCYGRAPTRSEVENTIEFFKTFNASSQPGSNRLATSYLSMATFCQGLISSAEFRYLY
ncbi:MAG: PSD1 and planctomycete cytochrome C domain-containing protein [Verrucomicrobiales bacterium]|nr:PSD1 and planctomycete cytochrome C domain-containing protein [Verrucomicrobiales bacterium]